MHSARGDGTSEYLQYQNDIEGLRQYHLNREYNYSTKSTTISRYISRFISYKVGQDIYIPRRSLSNKEPTGKGIHVRVTGMPYHGNIDDFYALLCPVTVINQNVDITPGVRQSLQPNKYE